MRVRIAEPSAETVKVVKDTANKGNYQLVVKPVEFEITCTNVTASNEEIKKFLSGYKDGGKVSSWATTAVVVCIRDGIVEGYNKELSVAENVTRAQTAAFVRRMLTKAGLI